MVTRLDLLLGILATCCNISALSFQPRRSARLAPWKAAKSRHRMSRPENHVDEVNNRRQFFGQVAGAFATVAAISIPSQEANARGLVQFPCTTPLLNEYILMRAGTTLMEEQDIWSTNPLFLTNREAALSETGIQQVQAASRQLASLGINPSVVKYSLAAAAMDTANIVKEELKVGQNRLVPEFFFMDPRAVGKFDMMSIEHTQPAIVAFDVNEAGPEGRGGRPPPNEDGTPHETLQDQSIRLRQLISGECNIHIIVLEVMT
jgi:broad specificity phosphatase PhoE